MGLNEFLHTLVNRIGGSADLHEEIDKNVPPEPADTEEVKSDAAE